MKVLLFGTGNYYQRYKDCFKNLEITGLLDNDAGKLGCLIDGHLVYHPEQAVNLSFEQIWLLSFAAEDMRKQLLSLGVDENIIYDIWDLGHVLGNWLVAPAGKYYVPNGGEREAVLGDAEGRVVLLTPNLMLNGAEIALVQMVKAMLQLGYNPLVASLRDGLLRDELLALEVPVILMGEAAHEIPLVKLPYLHGASAYIFNTIEMYMLMQERYKDIPVVWWLHDSEMVYKETNIKDKILSRINLNGVNIKVVSPIAAAAFNHHYGQKVSMEELPYGLQDWAGDNTPHNTYQTHQLTFSVIGNISRRKSQCDFICAIKSLPETIRKACRFFIIGSDRNQELALTLWEQAAGISNIHFMGEMGREELLRFYAEEMDILVCPSRCDTLPIVTVESMMFAHPVIASEAVGTANMLLDAGAGLSVQVGDEKALREAMQWMYEHPYECKRMGKAARQLYEEKFTMDKFHVRVDLLMQELVGEALQEYF